VFLPVMMIAAAMNPCTGSAIFSRGKCDDR
jgi:hypothetical protein